MPLRLREATSTDIPMVWALAQAFHRSGAWAGWIGEPKYVEILAACDLALQTGVVYLAELENGVVGAICIAVIRHPYTGEPFPTELMWFVSEDRRALRAGPLLLDAAEDWTRQQGYACLTMSAPAGSRVGTFLERRGYCAVETAYQVRWTDGSLIDPRDSRPRRHRRVPRGQQAEEQEPRGDGAAVDAGPAADPTAHDR